MSESLKKLRGVADTSGVKSIVFKTKTEKTVYVITVGDNEKFPADTKYKWVDFIFYNGERVRLTKQEFGWTNTVSIHMGRMDHE